MLSSDDEFNIFSADETGLFLRVPPDKTMRLKNETSVGKISKERLTVLLCSNMLDEFERTLIIGKSKPSPSNIEYQQLPNRLVLE